MCWKGRVVSERKERLRTIGRKNNQERVERCRQARWRLHLHVVVARVGRAAPTRRTRLRGRQWQLASRRIALRLLRLLLRGRYRVRDDAHTRRMHEAGCREGSSGSGGGGWSGRWSIARLLLLRRLLLRRHRVSQRRLLVRRARWLLLLSRLILSVAWLRLGRQRHATIRRLIGLLRLWRMLLPSIGRHARACKTRRASRRLSSVGSRSGCSSCASIRRKHVRSCGGRGVRGTTARGDRGGGGSRRCGVRRQHRGLLAATGSSMLGCSALTACGRSDTDPRGHLHFDGAEQRGQRTIHLVVIRVAEQQTKQTRQRERCTPSATNAALQPSQCWR